MSLLEMKFILYRFDHRYIWALQSSFMHSEFDRGSGLIRKMRRMSHKYEKKAEGNLVCHS